MKLSAQEKVLRWWANQNRKRVWGKHEVWKVKEACNDKRNTALRADNERDYICCQWLTDVTLQNCLWYAKRKKCFNVGLCSQWLTACVHPNLCCAWPSLLWWKTGKERTHNNRWEDKKSVLSSDKKGLSLQWRAATQNRWWFWVKAHFHKAHSADLTFFLYLQKVVTLWVRYTLTINTAAVPEQCLFIFNLYIRFLMLLCLPETIVQRRCRLKLKGEMDTKR